MLSECFAIHKDYRFLLIDERKGRRIAQKIVFFIAGIGVVLLAAKQKQFISSVEKELAKCSTGGIGYRLLIALRRKIKKCLKKATEESVALIA